MKQYLLVLLQCNTCIIIGGGDMLKEKQPRKKSNRYEGFKRYESLLVKRQSVTKLNLKNITRERTLLPQLFNHPGEEIYLPCTVGEG